MIYTPKYFNTYCEYERDYHYINTNPPKPIITFDNVLNRYTSKYIEENYKEFVKYKYSTKTKVSFIIKQYLADFHVRPLTWVEDVNKVFTKEEIDIFEEKDCRNNLFYSGALEALYSLIHFLPYTIMNKLIEILHLNGQTCIYDYCCKYCNSCDRYKSRELFESGRLCIYENIFGELLISIKKEYI